MVRTPCCSKQDLNKGAWTASEDMLLTQYINTHGERGWRSLPKKAGLNRCGKSCRLRWLNYLRPNIKRGNISSDEEELIIRMHRLLGNRWSLIAGRLPGRTDNEIKNYWNTHLSKKLTMSGVDPRTQKPVETVTWSPTTNSNVCVGVQEYATSYFMEDHVVRSHTPVTISDQFVLPDTHNMSCIPGSGGMPLFGVDDVYASKSWSKLLEESLSSDNLIDIQQTNDVIIESQSASTNIQISSCSSPSPAGQLEFSQPTHPVTDVNSTRGISQFDGSNSADHCILSTLPPSDNLIDFRIEEFCMQSLLEPTYGLEQMCPIQTSDCCADQMNCFAMAAEQGMAEIYNNTLQLDWRHEDYMKQSRLDLDSLGQLLDSEETWEDARVTGPTNTEEEYRDITVDYLSD
eukprot:Gb_22884 [translate_table: standard]